jgi:tetratricopeptide (TPR) repeat protein
MLKLWKSYALTATLVLGLACWVAPRAAAQDGKISGSVIDFDGKPWANVPLQLKSDQGTTQDAKTDADGKYQFTGLKPGKYTLTVSAPQVAPIPIPVDVHGDTPLQPINFKQMLEKNPEAAAAMKKQAEEKNKAAGMKQHYNAGLALLDQERAAKSDVAKAAADQKDAAKAKVTDLSNQAIAEFQEAQKAGGEKDPNQHLFWARMGDAYDMAGRNDEAINAYQQAVALKPDAGYYNNLGNLLARAGKIDDAKAAYTKSAELDPPNAAMAWRNFGISLYQAQRMVEAIEPLQKATQLDPKNAQGWYLLGTCMVADPSIYKQVGDKIEVTPKPGTAEAFQKAIELDPNGSIGAQAKAGLEQLNQLTGGIETKVGTKKKKP